MATMKNITMKQFNRVDYDTLNPATQASQTSYDNSTTGSTATTVQAVVDELFLSVSNGKSAIAGAITNKGVSTSSSASFQTMANNINSISPTLQSKTVSPSTDAQTIAPDSGYDGLSQVVVNAISPTKGAQTYTPKTTDQTISSGRWLTGDQKIKGDANLVADNIKFGMRIFGVYGAFPPQATDVNWHNNTSFTIRLFNSHPDHHGYLDVPPNSTQTTHYNVLGNLSLNIAYSLNGSRISVREVADKVGTFREYKETAPYKDYVAVFFLKGSNRDNIDVYFD